MAEVGKLLLSMILSDSEKKNLGRKNLVSKEFGHCSFRLVNLYRTYTGAGTRQNVLREHSGVKLKNLLNFRIRRFIWLAREFRFLSWFC